MACPKVYVGEILPDVPYIPLLYPNLGLQTYGNYLYYDVFKHLSKPEHRVIDLVEDVKQADLILVPHSVGKLRNRNLYLSKYVEQANDAAKPLIVFAYGDSAEAVQMPAQAVFRTSVYRASKEEREIVMPPYTEDLGTDKGFIIRRKTNTKATVGFCGWAGFPTAKQSIKAHVKDVAMRCVDMVDSTRVAGARCNGVLLRKKCLNCLQECNGLTPNFVVRNTFSRHMGTIELDPEVARKEYVSNMQQSDLALAVRGDGNFSVRFFEAISLGRIPLHVDSDDVFPLEDVIPYRDFVLSVPVCEVSGLCNRVQAYWNGLTPQQFKEQQLQARGAFVDYLRIDRFFSYMFQSADSPIRKLI